MIGDEVIILVTVNIASYEVYWGLIVGDVCCNSFVEFRRWQTQAIIRYFSPGNFLPVVRRMLMYRNGILAQFTESCLASENVRCFVSSNHID